VIDLLEIVYYIIITIVQSFTGQVCCYFYHY